MIVLCSMSTAMMLKLLLLFINSLRIGDNSSRLMSSLTLSVIGLSSKLPIINRRKQGHNETDQPSFTQPRMYEVIKNKKPALEIYINQLLAEGTLTKEDVEEHKKWYTLLSYCLIIGSGANSKIPLQNQKTTNQPPRSGWHPPGTVSPLQRI